MAGTGQEMWAHACKKCTKLYRGEDGRVCMYILVSSRLNTFLGALNFKDYLSAGVTDGVTVKHPCCSIEGNCMIPLLSPRDRYCPTHYHKRSECFVHNCSTIVEPGHFSCSNADHRGREAELLTRTHKGFYELTRRLRKAGVATVPWAGQIDDHCIPPPTADGLFLMSTAHTMTKLPILAALDPPAVAPPQNPPPRIHGSFTRKYTNNEQLLVRPCGVILSRATFYHAEGVASVRVRPFSVITTRQISGVYHRLLLKELFPPSIRTLCPPTYFLIRVVSY